MFNNDVESDDEPSIVPMKVEKSVFLPDGQRWDDVSAGTIVVSTGWHLTGKDTSLQSSYEAKHSIEFGAGITAEQTYPGLSWNEDLKSLDEEAQAERQDAMTKWKESFKRIASEWIGLAAVFHQPRKAGSQMEFSYTERAAGHEVRTRGSPMAAAPQRARHRIELPFQGSLAEKINVYIEMLVKDSSVKFGAKDVLENNVIIDRLRLSLIVDVFARNLACGPFDVVIDNPLMEDDFQEEY
ncbi:hypothetical protein QFC21_003506 [Naganishia friedmannii]|uniref:Uncharacterized protein n=1 Tax=Naganishia friedmannii TaxID=89922 RepID=A0ACC2VNH7_9TREE|nr:hypothetical protein QFC21_003506 [Naganishia friedmannii]